MNDMRTVNGLLTALTLGLCVLPGVSPGQDVPDALTLANEGELLKLTSVKSAAGDRYGSAVAMSGHIAVIGAPLNDKMGGDAGAVYIHERVNNAWTETRLTAPGGFTGYRFGTAVAISGETVLVGSPRAACGPSQGHDTQCGAAYIYERDAAGEWIGQKLISNDGNPWDWFGSAVAIQGDTALIGAFGDDDRGEGAGAAYVFGRNPEGVWVQLAKLTARDGGDLDWLGWSVAIDGNIAAVGAYNSGDVGLVGAGSVYVFVKTGGREWAQAPELVADDARPWDHLGRSVAVQGTTIMAGSHRNSEFGTSSGAVYVFDRLPTGWFQSQKLSASQPCRGAALGVSIAIRGDTAVVGAPGDVHDGIRSGSIYVFRRTPTGWIESKKLVSRDGDEFDLFGVAAALSGTVLLTGAQADDDQGRDSGSAYLFVVH